MKERTEAIWPPQLETALVEALEKYRPSNSQRDTRLLRRFPKRNQFISDYIFTTTGKRRTAKQVGSRLQQMKDTCADVRILNLLSRREYSLEEDSTTEPNTPSDFSTSTELTPPSTAPSPASSTSDVADAMNVDHWITPLTPPRTFVTIELVPPSSPASIHCSTFPPVVQSSHINHRCITLGFPSDIGSNDPVLTYSTPRKISIFQHYSHFRVLIGGVVAHSEITPLAFEPMLSIGTTRHTYSTKLIPRFWRQLCRSTQLFQCIIEQDILQTQASFEAIPTSPGVNDQSIRPVTYEFSLPRTTAPLFLPPPLRAEPSLPSTFPRAYASRFSTTQPRKASESYLSQALAPLRTSPDWYLFNGEYTPAGWDQRAQATNGLVSSTSFHPGFPSSSAPPYFTTSNSSYVQDLGVFAFGSLNQWPEGSNTNTDGVFSPTWSDAPMYSEFNTYSS
ncbi:hypothetical protein DFH07DRAFT_463732 [Mycena maculata]|uniref:TEA domain-containing protein n=1 Tax=Mycena maculata TaxID=230809 RepID=A0AAD7KA02_9AGAR|nr:hypothetical protein DFH07DRAFT_463732 [Mycena maculata]